MHKEKYDGLIIIIEQLVLEDSIASSSGYGAVLYETLWGTEE